MQHNMILYPLFALVALTFGIAIWMLELRFTSVINGDLNSMSDTTR